MKEKLEAREHAFMRLRPRSHEMVPAKIELSDGKLIVSKDNREEWQIKVVGIRELRWIPFKEYVSLTILPFPGARNAVYFKGKNARRRIEAFIKALRTEIERERNPIAVSYPEMK